jgi:hypothetical protein
MGSGASRDRHTEGMVERMTAVPKGRRRAGVFAGLVAVAAGLIFVLAAATASLPGSHFEIDASANLVQNDPSPSLDWASASVVPPAQVNKQDTPSGQNDDSYSGSTKEDSICPSATTGSIPNNKSDLLTFGAYVESEVDGPGFLNLFWRRVNDPSGTTLMDFELNKSSTNCAGSPNKVRTVGDLLLEYSIDQGGAQANITAREWGGSAWGPAIPLPGQALGTINNVAIPANQSDGLSTTPIAARTFGEMQLDLDFIFDEGSCESFGSAMVKSRSSDSFTSQMKDFIAPVPVNISNCGKVIIRKETDPDESPNATNFGYTKSFVSDPVSVNTFTLQDDGSKSYDVILGTDYSVVEDVIGAGYEFDNVDCSASTGVSPTITDELVEFDIDSAQDILDCTYTNSRQLGAIEITKTRKHAAADPSTQPHSGVDFTITGGDLPAGGTVVTTDASGVACLDGLAFASDYVVTESIPAGYVSDDAVKEAAVSANSDCGDGNEAKLAFENTPLTNIEVSVDSQVDGGTASTIDCDDNADDDPVETGADGDGSKAINDLEPGTYTCTVVVDP